MHDITRNYIKINFKKIMFLANGKPLAILRPKNLNLYEKFQFPKIPLLVVSFSVLVMHVATFQSRAIQKIK